MTLVGKGRVLDQGDCTAPATTVRRRPGRPTLSNEELLATALDLFLELGFERTSIDAITAAAGMAKRTVYARYGDKKTLFKAAIKRAIEEWIVPVERLRAAEVPDFEQTLFRIGRILLANILSPAGLRLLRLTNAESGRMPEIGVYNVEQGTEPTIAYLEDLFRRRLGPDFAEATDAAHAFLYLVVGGLANAAAWGVQADEQTVDRHLNYCIPLLLHGMMPQQEDAGPLAEENERLKRLLAEAMIRLDQAQEELARSRAGD